MLVQINAGQTNAGQTNARQTNPHPFERVLVKINQVETDASRTGAGQKPGVILNCSIMVCRGNLVQKSTVAALQHSLSKANASNDRRRIRFRVDSQRHMQSKGQTRWTALLRRERNQER